jgi:hypothetical protein
MVSDPLTSRVTGGWMIVFAMRAWGRCAPPRTVRPCAAARRSRHRHPVQFCREERATRGRGGKATDSHAGRAAYLRLHRVLEEQSGRLDPAVRVVAKPWRLHELAHALRARCRRSSAGILTGACALRYTFTRRDGRVVDGSGLENRRTGNRIVGSNPTPSANGSRSARRWRGSGRSGHRASDWRLGPGARIPHSLNSPWRGTGSADLHRSRRAGLVRPSTYNISAARIPQLAMPHGPRRWQRRGRAGHRPLALPTRPFPSSLAAPSPASQG